MICGFQYCHNHGLGHDYDSTEIHNHGLGRDYDSTEIHNHPVCELGDYGF